MQVPSLSLYWYWLATDKDGNQFKVAGNSVQGCWEMVQEMGNRLGIEISTTSVSKGNKRPLTPKKYNYCDDKQDCLAYLNWVINYPKIEGQNIFNNLPNRADYYENNPIKDVFIMVTRDRVKTEYNY